MQAMIQPQMKTDLGFDLLNKETRNAGEKQAHGFMGSL
jgi:hypothetical protein